MSLQGSLRTMSIGDLLDWIDRSFSCGCLTLERGAVTRTFHFDSGYITHASSNDATEHLGELLIRRGAVDQESLQNAFAVQRDTGVRLGKILLMVGAVTEEALRAALEEKIRDSLVDALSWAEGSFVFEPAPSTAVSEFEVSINLRAALEENAPRAERWRQIRAVIPSDETRLWIRDRGARAAAGNATYLAALLDKVAAGLQVRHIASELGESRFDVYDELAKLVEAGTLDIDRRQRPRAAAESELSVEELVRAARARADGGDRPAALQLVARALERDPENPLLKQLHEQLERAVFAELSRDLLTSFRVPRLLKSRDELDRLDLSDAERYLAGRIDGRWDLLSLMRISPLRHVEALLTFKRLADRGIIAL